MNVEELYEEFVGMDENQIVERAERRVHDLTGMTRIVFLNNFYEGEFQHNVDPLVLEAMYYLPLLETPRWCSCGATKSEFEPLIGDDVFEDSGDGWFHWYDFCFDSHELETE